MAFNLYTAEWGDFDLLLEDGGTFRVSTLPAANIPIGVLALGNYALLERTGKMLPLVTIVTNVPPLNTNQVSAYSGGNQQVCLLEGGVALIVPTGGSS